MQLFKHQQFLHSFFKDGNQIINLIQNLPPLLKFSKFQNDFMKSLSLPKYERKIVRNYPPVYTIQGRNPDNLSFIFWEKR